MSFVRTNVKTNIRINVISHNSPVGWLDIYFNERAITGLYFRGGKHILPKSPVDALLQNPVVAQVKKELDEYFKGKRRDFTVPIEMRGTPFQKFVWDRLLQVDYGEIKTYADIAKELGKPTASRAVGGAVGKNPISIIVPCHRIVGTSGKLTGFAGGIEAKKLLLELERG